MKFRRTFKVETVQNMGSDEMIARAARVSTGKDLTANLNNWLKFLDLRNGDKGHPQWEIVQCAQMVQARLTELYPITMGAWRS